MARQLKSDLPLRAGEVVAAMTAFNGYVLVATTRGRLFKVLQRGATDLFLFREVILAEFEL